MVAAALGLVGTARLTAGCGPSPFDLEVHADRPVAHLRGADDVLTGRRSGAVVGSPETTTLPHGGATLRYDGLGEHVSFPSDPAFSIATTGALSVEYWVRPDTLDFPDTEGSGFVHLLGKGGPGAHEWYARMYSRGNEEGRTNRLSGYAFAPDGGLGAGSYVERAVPLTSWTQVVLVFDTEPRPGAPLGTVTLYADGVREDSDSLADFGVRPRGGSAPLRVGTGYLGSYFRGAIGDVVFYDRVLPARRVAAHHRAMRAGTCTGT